MCTIKSLQKGKKIKNCYITNNVVTGKQNLSRKKEN